MLTNEEFQKRINAIYSDRAASTEDAVRGIIGNAEIVLGLKLPNGKPGEASQAEVAQHGLNLISHLAVMLGNATTALNEIAGAQQRLARDAEEATAEYAREKEAAEKGNVKVSRTFLGKPPN